jgi:dihydroxy-acid dehydratase
MAMTSAVVFALDGFGLIDDVAVITEGQLSGLVNKGLVIGEASPEAADEGVIGLLDDGDLITIDLHKRSVDHGLKDDVLAARRSENRRFGVAVKRGLLSLYRANVSPVHMGATLNVK